MAQSLLTGQFKEKPTYGLCFYSSFVHAVLSSEMDPAEIRLIRKPFLKERSAEVFSKIRCPPSCESPFKLQRHLVQ